MSNTFHQQVVTWSIVNTKTLLISASSKAMSEAETTVVSASLVPA